MIDDIIVISCCRGSVLHYYFWYWDILQCDFYFYCFSDQFFLYSKYGLEDDTVDFIGHALALHKDDSYLDQPATDFVKRVKVMHLVSCFHFFSYIHGLWRGWNDSHLTRAKVEFDPFCTAWFPFFHFKCTTSWSDLIILGVFIYSSMAPSYGIKHINCIGRTRFFKWRKVWLHSCRNKDQSMFRLLENSF